MHFTCAVVTVQIQVVSLLNVLKRDGHCTGQISKPLKCKEVGKHRFSLGKCYWASTLQGRSFSPSLMWSWLCKSTKMQNYPKKNQSFLPKCFNCPKKQINPICWSHGRLQPVSSQRRPMAPKHCFFFCFLGQLQHVGKKVWVFWDSSAFLKPEAGKQLFS